MKLADVHVGNPVVRGALTVFPVFNGAAVEKRGYDLHAPWLGVAEQAGAPVVEELVVTNEGPRPALVLEGELLEGGWQHRPGTFVRMDETLRDAALRALREKVGETGQEPRQLRVFDAVDRDSRGRVMSVAHVDLVPPDRLEGTTGTLLPIDPTTRQPVLPDRAGGLSFDHDRIVEAAVEWARDAYQERPDPRHLIGEEFTLLELQRVHEAVLGRPWQKDTFRRHMVQHLDETGGLSRGTVGKPARLFRRRPPEHAHPA